MNDNQPYIIPETETAVATEERASNRSDFAIGPHLLLAGLILVALFSSVIIPALFKSGPQPSSAVTSAPTASADTQPPVGTLEAIPPVAVGAEAVHVYDIATGRTLLQKNAETVKPLASITKLMTTLVAYELIEDGTTVTISPAAARQLSGGTLRAGEQFSVRPLADFALVTSFNSAAYALGDAVGSLLGSADPLAQFVAAMNIRAKELGFSTFNFHNPTGLDESTTLSGGYGSAAEVSALMTYIYHEYPELLLPTIAPTTRLLNTTGETHTANNTNDIVSEIPGLRGSKTGYTDLAGGNLTIVFDAAFNRPIVVTVLGSTRSGRYVDIQKIVEAINNSLLE